MIPMMKIQITGFLYAFLLSQSRKKGIVNRINIFIPCSRIIKERILDAEIGSYKILCKRFCAEAVDYRMGAV